MALEFDFKDNSAAVRASLEIAKKRGLEICGEKAESYAKALCPTKTGTLKNSITHFPKDNDEYIGTPVKYAPFVELGHHQQPGRFVPAIGKRLKKEWVPGKPFLRPAAQDHADEYKAIFEAELRKG